MVNLNKKISTLLSLTIIIVLAVIVGGGSLILQQKIEFKPSEIIQTSTNETAGWKTYTSDKYGFQVNYPSNYTFRETTNGLGPQECWQISRDPSNDCAPLTYDVIFSSKNFNITVHMEPRPRGYSDFSYVTENTEKMYKEGEKYQFSEPPGSRGYHISVYRKLKVAGQDVIKWATYSQDQKSLISISVSYMVNRLDPNNIISYSIAVGADGSGITQSDEKIFDLFVSTFKFTLVK